MQFAIGTKYQFSITTVDERSHIVFALTLTLWSDSTPVLFAHHGSQCSGCNGDDSQRTAGATNDFQWRGNDDGPGRGKLIKVGQTGQPKLAASMHEVVVRKGRIKSGGLSSISSNRLHADT